MMKTRSVLAVMLLTQSLALAQGTAFTYQGRLTDSGTPFNGTAELQFTLWDAATNGSQVASTMPPSITLPVSNGLFTAPIDFGSTAFTGSVRWLQIQARTTLGPYTTLHPRQPLTSTPYAIHSVNAATADSVTSPIPDALLSSNVARLNSSPTFTGTVTAGAFSGDGSALMGITRLDGASNGPVGALSVDALGHVAIGTNDSGAALQVAGGGTFGMPQFRGAITNGSPGVSNLVDPNHIFISGNRAYVTCYFPGALMIFDISNPLQPVLLGQAVDQLYAPGSPFQKLEGAEMVYVTNNVAYVTAANENALTIIDVSNPSSPTKLAEVVHGVGGVTNLNFPVGIHVWNNRAFVLANGSSALLIFDVSNPAAPILIKDIMDDSVRPGSPFTRLRNPFQMTRVGTRLYIAANGDNAVSIVDVADPANPQPLGTIADISVSPGSPFTRLRSPYWVDVVGNVAYVAAGGFNSALGSLTLIDVSNPASPIKLAEINDDSLQPNSPFTKLRGAWAVKVVNNTAFVTCNGDNALTVIDVSNPSQPRLVREFVDGREGIRTMRFTQGLALQGDTLYVLGSWSSALNIFSLQSTLGLNVENFVGIGTATPRTELEVAGTITASSLSVENGMRVSGDWDGENGALEVEGDKPTIRFNAGPVAGNQSWLMHVGSEGPGNLGFYQREFGFVNRLSIATSGNVGVGIANPGTKMHLYGGQSQLRIQSDSSSSYSTTEYLVPSRTWHTGVGGSAVGGGLNQKYYIFDASAGAVRMVVDTIGYVGIGTTSPGAALDVRTTSGTGNAIRFGYYTGGVGNLIAGPSRVGIATGDDVERISIPQSTGNIGIGTLTPSQKLHVMGNILATGTITPNSDVNAKTNFMPVDVADVLERVTKLPIQQWRFKAEAEEVKHVGPMAQDFRAAFGLGEIPTAIATVDADGVALAAIQGLNQKLEEKNAEIEELKRELASIKAAVRKLSGSMPSP